MVNLRAPPGPHLAVTRMIGWHWNICNGWRGASQATNQPLLYFPLAELGGNWHLNHVYRFVWMKTWLHHISEISLEPKFMPWRFMHFSSHGSRPNPIPSMYVMVYLPTFSWFLFFIVNVYMFVYIYIFLMYHTWMLWDWIPNPGKKTDDPFLSWGLPPKARPEAGKWDGTHPTEMGGVPKLGY